MMKFRRVFYMLRLLNYVHIKKWMRRSAGINLSLKIRMNDQHSKIYHEKIIKNKLEGSEKLLITRRILVSSFRFLFSHL